MNDRLHYHPYKISTKQEFQTDDMNKRLMYCQWFNEHLRNDDILNMTFFSDEAWFHLSGHINSQNVRYWSSENPHAFTETSLHPIKVGVWVAMSRARIIGPIFFDETVTGDLYREILEMFINELNEHELHQEYFQHDNAPAHTANDTIQYLRRYYGNRIISAGLWPPRSPDLTPLDYFLFGHLKSQIYKNQINTQEELRNLIAQVIQEITQQQLIKVFDNMKKRINACIQRSGFHFEHRL